MLFVCILRPLWPHSMWFLGLAKKRESDTKKGGKKKWTTSIFTTIKVLCLPFWKGFPVITRQKLVNPLELKRFILSEIFDGGKGLGAKIFVISLLWKEYRFRWKNYARGTHSWIKVRNISVKFTYNVSNWSISGKCYRTQIRFRYSSHI